MIQKYEQELEQFKQYNFPEFVWTDLDAYYAAKEKYIENHEDDFIHQKFDLAYTSIKSQWVCGRISENTFWKLVKLLKGGVIV